MGELHPACTVKALMPRYVSRFNCTGAACEDTCCRDWNISLDRTTFDAYRKSKHPELGQRLAESVQPPSVQGGDPGNAIIRLRPDNRECPLLDDHLCAVQKILGESYLSHTCFVYPRVPRLFAGQHEVALTLSCPEAARQALLTEDAFDFVEEPLTLRTDVVERLGARPNLPVELMNEIRIYCIQLMQTRSLELWQKLAILGGFCEALTSAIANGGQAGGAALLQSYILIVEEGFVVDALADLHPDHAVQAQTSLLLWQCTAKVKLTGAKKNLFDFVWQGLGADPETEHTGPQQLAENYGRGVDRLNQALAAAAPKLLEHYVLNELFRELFPFRGASPYEHYLTLVFRFTLLRLVLAARCNASDGLPDGMALSRTVQLFCRHFQHDLVFTQQVSQALSNHGWDKLKNVYRVLRT